MYACCLTNGRRPDVVRDRLSTASTTPHSPFSLFLVFALNLSLPPLLRLFVASLLFHRSSHSRIRLRQEGGTGRTALHGPSRCRSLDRSRCLLLVFPLKFALLVLISCWVFNHNWDPLPGASIRPEAENARSESADVATADRRS